MQNKKIEALESCIKALNISTEELNEWFANRNKTTDNSENLVATELPIVYRQFDSFIVKNGLDTNLIDEVWGIQIPSGIMIAKEMGTSNSVSSASWFKYYAFSKKMKFNGQKGSLPSIKNYKCKNWQNEVELPFNNTVNILLRHGIDADEAFGRVFCLEDHERNIEFDRDDSYQFSMKGGEIDWHDKSAHSANRLGIIF